MNLHPRGKEWYALEIATEPAVPGWEASFDEGATWIPSTAVGTDGWFRWFVAGPDADPTGNPANTTTLPLMSVKRTIPLIRAEDNPEDIIRQAPPIDVK